jgi:hypothetical protein
LYVCQTIRNRLGRFTVCCSPWSHIHAVLFQVEDILSISYKSWLDKN